MNFVSAIDAGMNSNDMSRQRLVIRSHMGLNECQTRVYGAVESIGERFQFEWNPDQRDSGKATARIQVSTGIVLPGIVMDGIVTVSPLETVIEFREQDDSGLTFLMTGASLSLASIGFLAFWLSHQFVGLVFGLVFVVHPIADRRRRRQIMMKLRCALIECLG